VKNRRVLLIMSLVVGMATAVSGGIVSGQPGLLFSGSTGSRAGSQSQAPGPKATGPDWYKLPPGGPLALAVPGQAPGPLPHPCPGMYPEPPFDGVSPLSITYVPGMCANGYGDIAVWQAGGHSYVVLSGFAGAMLHIFNVDDPYNPVVLRTLPFPAGGSTSTTIFAFKQGLTRYVSVGMRGSGTGCGWFVYNVNDPANPVLVTRKSGTDWCTVHEHFVSADANGDADYAWLTMSGESGSGYKVVVLDIRNMNNIQETGRYQRADAGGGNFNHDVTVIGNRVFLAHWGGGVLIHDKETLAHSTNPTPLNPIDSIRPSGFNVHHMWPTSDGNYLFIEDEFLNASNAEKIKLYNISDVTNPRYIGGIIGSGIAATSQAHNLKIKNLAPGRDLLLVGWYKAGTRGFIVDTTGPTPVITQTLMHQLAQSAGPGFGNVWGVDYLPCTLRGQASTCIYSSDMTYGLVADAFGYDPTLDPYAPTSQITDPTSGQTITSCSYAIQGTAHDYWSGVASVEISLDGGTTWSPAQGTDNWSYQWSIHFDGPYVIKTRARDRAGNIETPTGLIKVIALGGCGAATTTPGATNTAVPTGTPIPTQTPTQRATAVPSDTPANTATSVPANTVTNTPVDTATSTPVPCSISFSDVSSSDYFYEAVRYLSCHGSVTGYDDGTFRPYNLTTRGQLAKIVVLAMGLPIYTPQNQTFMDVPPDHPFYRYVETAQHAGIVSGYGCGAGCLEYRPDNNITRGQLSKVVVLAAGWTLVVPSTPTFRDLPASDAFYGYVETAYQGAIISGYGCGTGCLEFRPGNNATRGQISKIVYLAVTRR
jgi:hypothetical protein